MPVSPRRVGAPVAIWASSVLVTIWVACCLKRELAPTLNTVPRSEDTETRTLKRMTEATITSTRENPVSGVQRRLPGGAFGAIDGAPPA